MALAYRGWEIRDKLSMTWRKSVAAQGESLEGCDVWPPHGSFFDNLSESFRESLDDKEDWTDCQHPHSCSFGSFCFDNILIMYVSFHSHKKSRLKFYEDFSVLCLQVDILFLVLFTCWHVLFMQKIVWQRWCMPFQRNRGGIKMLLSHLHLVAREFCIWLLGKLPWTFFWNSTANYFQILFIWATDHLSVTKRTWDLAICIWLSGSFASGC